MAMTVPDRSLKMSWLKIRTERVPAGSFAHVGLRLGKTFLGQGALRLRVGLGEFLGEPTPSQAKQSPPQRFVIMADGRANAAGRTMTV